MNKLFPIVVALLFFSFSFPCVGCSSAVFLLISPSTTMNGLGESGVSPTTSDIYSVYYNPAQINLPSGISFQYSSMKEPWLPGLGFNGINIENKLKMIGFNDIFFTDKILYQFSISELNTMLHLGEQTGVSENGNPTANWNSYMTSDAITFSLGLQFKKNPIFLGFGVTHKKIFQKLAIHATAYENGSGNPSSTDYAYDWGIRFSIDDYKSPVYDKIALTFSMGYSKSNIGDKVYFIDKTRGDPLPRLARLGLTWGGKVYVFENLGISFRSIHEVEDVLLKSVNDEVRYQESLLGDINFKKHILSGQADEDVTLHEGIEINMFDIYYHRQGEFTDIAGSLIFDTEGYGVNITNLINILYPHTNKFLNYFNLSYNCSKILDEQGAPRENTSFSEITLSFKDMGKIF